MIADMYSGYTNQVVNDGRKGHGPISHYYYSYIPADYWFVNGAPTYYQNLEAWAEYFSSQMTGNAREHNQELFPEACETMDRIAFDLLINYREKHFVKYQFER